MPHPIAPCRRLLILACSVTKRGRPIRIPARDRYDGPLWRTLRAADPDGCKAKVAFLSARFGFRDADTPIDDYDARLTADLAQRMIDGEMTTRWPRPPSARGPDTFGIYPGAEIASLSLTRQGRIPPCRRPALCRGHARFRLRVPAHGLCPAGRPHY